MTRNVVGALGFAAVLGWLGALILARAHGRSATAPSWTAIAFAAALGLGGAGLEWRCFGADGLRLLAFGLAAGASGALLVTFHRMG